MEEVEIYRIPLHTICMGSQNPAQLLALLLIARTGRMEADTLPCSVLVFLVDICLSSCLLALVHHAVVPPVGEPQTGFTALRILLFIRSDLQLSALS